MIADESARLAVGFHVPLKQFVFSDSLVRQLSGLKIGQVTHPCIRKSDSGVSLDDSFFSFPLV